MRILLLGMIGFGFGCQTNFVGSPHIDPETCQARCSASHMEMSGMVYMGDYSSACLCEVPRPNAAPSAAPGAAAAVSGAAAGVVMQMRRADDRYNQLHHW